MHPCIQIQDWFHKQQAKDKCLSLPFQSPYLSITEHLGQILQWSVKLISVFLCHSKEAFLFLKEGLVLYHT